MIRYSTILPLVFLIHQGGRVTPWRYEFTRNQSLHPIPSHTSISLNSIGDRPLFPLWPYIDVCCTTQDTYLPSNPNNWRVWRSSVLRLLDFPLCSFKSSTNLLNSSIYLHMTFNLKENQFNHTLLWHVHIIRVLHTWINLFGKSIGSKETTPWIMWNLVAYGASMEVLEDWKWHEHLLWYHVKLAKLQDRQDGLNFTMKE